MLVELAPAARIELDEAAARYEADRAGRGLRFYAAVERTVALLAAFPESGALYVSVGAELGVRRVVVRGLPFLLFYRMNANALRIDAVAHMHRRPGYWRRRI